MAEAWRPIPVDEVKDEPEVSGRLLEVLQDAETPQRLDDYFGESGWWAGGWFDRIGRYEHGPNDIGCHDLLSLTLLDVAVPSYAARSLLFDPRVRGEVSRLLSTIPTDVTLWDTSNDDALIAGDDLWRYFESSDAFRGMGARSNTIRSKLLSRKRPNLIPISDSVVLRYLGCRGDLWSTLRACLRLTPAIIEASEGLKTRVASCASVPTLRILDASIWVHHSPSARKHYATERP